MLRFWTACLALILTPLAWADGKELKPKFGDIGGVFYTEVQGDREACRQAIKNKIALCRQNTSFVSNTLDRKYPGCLPIFQQQADICVAHFRRQESQCEIQGSARITDFTGFACTVTATTVEEGGESERTPGIAPADRTMQARTRTNVRGGPGTDHAKVGLLEAGDKVHVTGEAGEWLRIEGPDGSTAFVHGSLLVAPAPQGSDATAALSPKCAGMSEGAECWRKLTDPPGCYFWRDYFVPDQSWTWSGQCAAGVVIGEGTLSASRGSVTYVLTGTFVQGKQHGHWVWRSASGSVSEGPYVDGRAHGHWVEERFDHGSVDEGPYVDGKRHGPWVERFADGTCLNFEWSRDKIVSRSDC